MLTQKGGIPQKSFAAAPAATKRKINSRKKRKEHAKRAKPRNQEPATDNYLLATESTGT
jgi:hypothetical protein